MTTMRLQWTIAHDVDLTGPLPAELLSQITAASSLVRDLGCEVESEVVVTRDGDEAVALLLLETPEDWSEADSVGMLGVLRGYEP